MYDTKIYVEFISESSACEELICSIFQFSYFLSSEGNSRDIITRNQPHQWLRFHECSISWESFAASSTSCRQVKIVCYVCRLFFHRLGLTMSYLRCKLIKLLPRSFFVPPVVEIPLARRIFATCTCNETTRNMV